MAVLALTPRPMSILPAKRLPQFLFSSVCGDVGVEPVPGKYDEGENKVTARTDSVGVAPGRGGKGGDKDDCPGRWA